MDPAYDRNEPNSLLSIAIAGNRRLLANVVSFLARFQRFDRSKRSGKGERNDGIDDSPSIELGTVFPRKNRNNRL